MFEGVGVLGGGGSGGQFLQSRIAVVLSVGWEDEGWGATYPNPEDVFHGEELGHCVMIHLQSLFGSRIFRSECEGLG